MAILQQQVMILAYLSMHNVKISALEVESCKIVTGEICCIDVNKNTEEIEVTVKTKDKETEVFTDTIIVENPIYREIKSWMPLSVFETRLNGGWISSINAVYEGIC